MSELENELGDGGKIKKELREKGWVGVEGMKDGRREEKKGNEME